MTNRISRFWREPSRQNVARRARKVKVLTEGFVEAFPPGANDAPQVEFLFRFGLPNCPTDADIAAHVARELRRFARLCVRAARRLERGTA